MKRIHVTKEFAFDMAHALQHYEGLCKNIHGHTYRLFVTVAGEPNTQAGASDEGMVIDFGLLKKIVNENIVHIFDHALVLHQNYPFDEKVTQTKLIRVEYQPTCENLLFDFVDRITSHLPEYAALTKVRLYETITSFATWYADDQK